MSEPTAVAAVDPNVMTPEQKKNWEATVAAHQPAETAEAKAAREKVERDARIEFERRDQVSRTFAVKHADTFAPGTYNAEKMLSEMGTLPWTVENLEQTFERLTKQGQLLPPPYKDPVPAAPQPFDYRGLTLKKLKAMSRTEYKEKLDSPEYAPIIAQIVKDYNEGKSHE